jgi:PncC family amidohydrolase
VPQAMLDQHGAVSEQVARAMSEGALRISGADDALAITGIAGPVREDEPSEKPVGTVYIGLARRDGAYIVTTTRRFQFPGDRTAVRDRSAKMALQMLRFSLLDQPADLPLLWEYANPRADAMKAPAQSAIP